MILPSTSRAVRGTGVAPSLARPPSTTNPNHSGLRLSPSHCPLPSGRPDTQTSDAPPPAPRSRRILPPSFPLLRHPARHGLQARVQLPSLHRRLPLPAQDVRHRHLLLALSRVHAPVPLPQPPQQLQRQSSARIPALAQGEGVQAPVLDGGNSSVRARPPSPTPHSRHPCLPQAPVVLPGP